MKPARSRQEIAPAPLAAARIVKARLSRHASGVPQRRDEADGMVLDVGPCLVGQGQAGPMLQRPRQVGEGAVHDAGGQRKAAPAEQQDADLAAGIADGGQALAAQVAVEADVEQQPAACLVGYRGGLVGKAERLETEVSNRHLEQCRIQLPCRRHGRTVREAAGRAIGPGRLFTGCDWPGTGRRLAPFIEL